jgi:hypothetical protein
MDEILYCSERIKSENDEEPNSAKSGRTKTALGNLQSIWNFVQNWVGTRRGLSQSLWLMGKVSEPKCNKIYGINLKNE